MTTSTGPRRPARRQARYSAAIFAIPCRAELLCDEPIGGVAEVSALLLPLAKVRLQRLADARVQGRPELLAEGRFVEGDGLPEAARHEQPNRPGVQVEEQVE